MDGGNIYIRDSASSNRKSSNSELQER
jgi:hypothetical protein